jgi:HTH-type transcriptional regulator, transcriptional repressor of NAD biosynthesis genes
LSERFARGLVVGKFWPLHKGHQLVIERAQAACDEVVVISYGKPVHPRYPAALRDDWLATLHPAVRRLVIDDASLADLCRQRGLAVREIPHNEADGAQHREFCGWLCEKVLGVAVDAVFTSEDYGDAFAAALTQRFGRPVQHVSVDRERQTVPVSGTQVRADPGSCRDWVDPRVHADLVRRVAMIGCESSGKSSLAQALAFALGSVWVPEYGRELWERRGGQLVFDDMVAIAREQVARERRQAPQANGWLVCDTSPLTTLFYSAEMFGRVDPELERLAGRPYDLLVLCEPDFAFEQDGTRRGEDFSRGQQAWYVAEVRRRGLPCLIASGGLEDRVRTVRERLLALSAPAAVR